MGSHPRPLAPARLLHIHRSLIKRRVIFASTIARVALEPYCASPGNLGSRKLCLAQDSRPAQVTQAVGLKSTNTTNKSVRTIRLAGEVDGNTMIEIKKYYAH